MLLWETEGDFKEFDYKGYKCQIKRHVYLKNLCGYVFLPKDHALASQDPFCLALAVHGGITYGELVGENYILGFDCAHCEDLVPGMHESLELPFLQIYRSMQYVEEELKELVDQIVLLDNPKQEE